MAKTIRISDNLALPADAVTQTFAFLARRGAGKSYGAMKLAEGMLESDAQIIAIDPVGVWYSLRIAADGKGKGFDLPILGGLHGDIPLEPGAGALIADLIVDRGISAVLDVSMFRKNERKQFATAFAEQLFHRKKERRSPLHFFVEEAQVFVPQFAGSKGEGSDARMLGAFEDLVKLGRNFGIGVTLISQRPQSVNKDALNQTEALFVLQTNGAQERKALENWIVEQGVDNKKLVDELPSLPIGTAYLWSPSWLRKLEKVKIGKRETYNASATPTSGQERAEPRPLSKAELIEVEQAMSATIARAKADDPKELRKQIAELQRQVKIMPAKAETIVERVEVPVLPEATAAELREVVAAAGKLLDRFVAITDQIGGALARVHRPASVVVPPRTVAPRIAPQRQSGTASSDVSLGKAERMVMTALAQNPQGCEKTQLGILAGYSPGSGHFNNIMGKLRSAGYVNRGEPIAITQEGIDALGSYEPLPTGEALRAYWLGRLGKAEGAILTALIGSYPQGLTKDELGAEAGYSSNSGHFNNVLGKLRTLKLAEGYGEIKASGALFTEAYA
jgi:hypothetical protein